MKGFMTGVVATIASAVIALTFVMQYNHKHREIPPLEQTDWSKKAPKTHWTDYPFHQWNVG